MSGLGPNRLGREAPTARAVQPHAAQQWLLLRAVAEAAGVHARTVERQAGAMIRSSREHRAANGKAEREVLLSSLPAEWQAKVRAAAQEQQVGTSYHLSKEQQAVGRIRLAALAPMEEARAAGRPLSDEAKRIARGLDNSDRQIWNWWSWKEHGRSDCGACRKRFCANPTHKKTFNYLPGVESLADHTRSDAGKSRYFDNHQRAAAFLLVKRSENLTDAHAYDAMVREWGTLGETGDPPSFSTAIRFLAGAVPPPADDLIRLGEKKVRDRHASSLRRARPAPMDCWVLDHRRHDVFCWLSMFPEKPAGTMWRLWLTAIYDWGSGAIVGWCFAPEPSSNTINSALRMAVAEHGFPRELYWDRGRDFQRVQRILESEEVLAGLLRGHKVSITRALPYNARAKPIESWFTAWSSRFDRTWGAAYAGNRPDHCLPICRAAQHDHALYLRGERDTTLLPADAEFIEHAGLFIEEWNKSTAPHTMKRAGAGVPQTRAALLAPESGRNPTTARVLDCLFFKREPRKVHAGGCVVMDKLEYEPTAESYPSLGMRSGAEVIVARDPYDFSTALAYDRDTGAFLGELRVRQLALQGEHGRLSEALIKEVRKREAQLKKITSNYWRAVSMMAAEFGIHSEREYRAQRLLGKRGGIEPPPPMRSPAKLGAGARAMLSDPFEHCKASDEDAALLPPEEASA